MLAFLSASRHMNHPKVLVAVGRNANVMVLAHRMHNIHKDIVELGANKGLETHRRTAGLVCRLEALEAFLCPHMQRATRLASARCSKHNQGRRRSRALFASKSAVKVYCLLCAVNGRVSRAMCSSIRTAAFRDKQTR